MTWFISLEDMGYLRLSPGNEIHKYNITKRVPIKSESNDRLTQIELETNKACNFLFLIQFLENNQQ